MAFHEEGKPPFKLKIPLLNLNHELPYKSAPAAQAAITRSFNHKNCRLNYYKL